MEDILTLCCNQSNLSESVILSLLCLRWNRSSSSRNIRDGATLSDAKGIPDSWKLSQADDSLFISLLRHLTNATPGKSQPHMLFLVTPLYQ